MKKLSLQEYEERATCVPSPYQDLKTDCLLYPTKADSIARRVFQLRHGPIGDPKVFVCHKCDRTNCIESDHHFLGSCGDNLRDCVKKGRMERSGEHKAALAASNRTRIWSPQSVAKVRKALTGRKLSEEHKRNISKSLMGALNPRYKGKRNPK